MNIKDKLIIAVDDPNQLHLIPQLEPYCAAIKIRPAAFYAYGQRGVANFVSNRTGLMLDLKCHDIPSRVALDVSWTLALHPTFITVHSQGGSEMIAAARRAAEDGHDRAKILAVIALSSRRRELDTGRLKIRLLARMAVDNGADGLVCAPSDLLILRDYIPDHVTIVVPGIREHSNDRDDHATTMTAEDAIKHGADYVVIGRPITQDPNPILAAQRISEV